MRFRSEHSEPEFCVFRQLGATGFTEHKDRSFHHFFYSTIGKREIQVPEENLQQDKERRQYLVPGYLKIRIYGRKKDKKSFCGGKSCKKDYLQQKNEKIA
ncbi:MAG: hypothetical protein J6T08_07365 [Lentisphaeria bacterium]|nr:hypothetical protein [Lentisphaeria bacterium]